MAGWPGQPLAALWLVDHGHSATILAARPRLGGRADSRDWGQSGGPVEYGGGWIRTDHAEVIALAQRLGINLTPRAAITSHSHFRDGSFHLTPADDMAEHNAAIATLQTDAAQMASDSPADPRHDPDALHGPPRLGPPRPGARSSRGGASPARATPPASGPMNM